MVCTSTLEEYTRQGLQQAKEIYAICEKDEGKNAFKKQVPEKMINNGQWYQ